MTDRKLLKSLANKVAGFFFGLPDCVLCGENLFQNGKGLYEQNALLATSRSLSSSWGELDHLDHCDYHTFVNPPWFRNLSFFTRYHGTSIINAEIPSVGKHASFSACRPVCNECRDYLVVGKTPEEIGYEILPNLGVFSLWE